MTISTAQGEFAIALQYAGYNQGTVKAAFAKGRVTLTGLPANNDTVTINAHMYTFKTVLAGADQVLIGTTTAATAQNLMDAILATAAKLGVTVGAATVANTDVTAEASTGVVFLTAITAGKAANAFTLAKSGTNISLSGAVLSGGLDAAAFDETTLSWMRMRSEDIDYNAMQIQSTIEPEIGKVVEPTGAYKSGVALHGGASLKPRLQNSMGHLLLASMGQVVTVNNGDGTYTHTFTYKTNDDQYQPWVAVRKMIPGTGQVDPLGLLGFDNKVGQLRLAVAAARPVEARVDFTGIFPKQDHHPDVWLGSTFEDFSTAALACKGVFKLPTIAALPNPMPVTQVIVEQSNALTSEREEFIVGSYFMDDIITRFRALTVRFIYKWNDSALNDYLFGNANRAVNWDPTPFRTVTASTNYAFDLLVQSPKNIASTQVPYSLRIRANDCYWEPGQPMRMQGGGIVMMEVVGTVLAPTSGAYTEFILTNDTASYTIPAQP